MPALYSVGATLPNGETVVTDTFTTGSNGTTTEVILDSIGDTFTINGVVAGNPQANQSVIQERVVANLATLQAWTAANPDGAILTAAETLVLAKMITALTLLVLGSPTTTTGT